MSWNSNKNNSSILRHFETGDPIINPSGLYYSLMHKTDTQNISFAEFVKQKNSIKSNKS
jgi:hypothetical protein